MDHTTYPPPKSVMDAWPEPTARPTSIAWLLPSVCLPLFVLALVAVALRTYTRVKHKTFGQDDMQLLSSVPFSIALCTLTIVGTKYGIGMHIWDVKPEWYPIHRKIMFALEIINVLAHGPVKLSLCFFYLRLFSPNELLVRRMTYAGMIVMALFGVWAVLGILFQCGASTIYAYWTPGLGPKHCKKSLGYMASMYFFNCLANFYLICLPMHKIWHLRMRRKQKIILNSIMAIGFIGCLLSVIKFYYFFLYFTDRLWDSTYYLLRVCLFCSVENSLTMFAVTVPALRSLTTKGVSLRSKLYGTGSSSKGGTLNSESASRSRRQPSQSFSMNLLNSRHADSSVEIATNIGSLAVQFEPPKKSEFYTIGEAMISKDGEVFASEAYCAHDLEKQDPMVKEQSLDLSLAQSRTLV